MKLLHAACDALEVSGPGGDRASFQTETRKAEGSIQELCTVPHAFLIEYADGCKAAMLMLNGYVREPSAAGCEQTLSPPPHPSICSWCL